MASDAIITLLSRAAMRRRPPPPMPVAGHACFAVRTRTIEAERLAPLAPAPRATAAFHRLILDVRMSGMSGLELQERLIAENASLPIIFVTGHGDVPMAVSTMKKGAMDFIEKPFDEAELRKLVERMLDKARSESSTVQQQRAAAERLGKLTAREHQVLERIIAGRLNKQIADDLGISIKTVEAHRANIMEKLNANTVADLLKIALGAQSKA
jgi:FixJ family two-component response regulator